MVIILSTKAEFLAISQRAKEAIYLSYLMQVLNLIIPQAFIVECNNVQII